MNQTENKLPETGFLRLNAVLQFIPIGKSSWWEGIKQGIYPKPVKIGSVYLHGALKTLESLLKPFPTKAVRREIKCP